MARSIDEKLKRMRARKGQPTSSQVHVPSTGEEDKVLLKTRGMTVTIEKDKIVQKREKRPIIKTDGPRRVATVAVRHGNHMLMGKRRDNGLWTTPGGHLDPHEDFPTGALRELLEETGISCDPGDLSPLSEIHGVKDKQGKPLYVQPFKVELSERPQTSMTDDPDAEVHRWQWIDVSHGLPRDIAGTLHTPLERNVLMQACGFRKAKDAEADAFAEMVTPPLDNLEAEVLKELSEMPEQSKIDELFGLQLLVEGMDWELEHTTTLPEEAKETALATLEDDPMHYRKLRHANDSTDDVLEKGEEPWNDEGFFLDLGSGQTREMGHIGLDLYPYDHGTLVHDVEMGIPFPDESCSQVKMTNLNEVDPKAVLSEIHRVMMPGGQFVYEGPNDIYNSPSWAEDYPGLVLTSHESSEPFEDLPLLKSLNEGQEDPPIQRQVFTRIALPDPATADDAEPRVGDPAHDQLPADALLAMDALSYYYSDATSSGRGNRAEGYPSQGALDKEADSSGAGDSNQKVKWVKEMPSEPVQAEVHAALNPVNPNPPPPKMLKRGSKIEKALKKERIVPIFKANTRKQIVYGVVLAPNEIDAQDDFMEPDEIEKAAHRYLANSRVVGSGHSKPIKAYPVESFIAPQDFEVHGQYGNQAVKQGSWVLGVKIEDPEEWRKVMEGEYQGFSVGGFGARMIV